MLSETWFDKHYSNNNYNLYKDDILSCIPQTGLQYFNFSYNDAIVKIKNKYNYIKNNGTLLSSTWFDFICLFHDILIVKHNNKYLFINKKGKPFKNIKYFDSIICIHNNLMCVSVRNKYNIIKLNIYKKFKPYKMNYIYNLWLDDIIYTNECKHTFKIKKNNKYNYLDNKGNLIYNNWIIKEHPINIVNCKISDFVVFDNNEVGYTIQQYKHKRIKICNNISDYLLKFITTDKKYHKIYIPCIHKYNIHNNYNNIKKLYNILNTKTNQLLFSTWYDEIFNISEDSHNILFIEWETWQDNKKIKKFNIADINGKLLLNDWAIDCELPNGSIYIFKLKTNKYVLYNINKNKFFDLQFNNIIFSYYPNCYFIVNIKNKYNFVSSEEKYLFNDWLDRAYIFQNNYSRININQKWNFVHLNGKLINDKWFDNAKCFNNGFAAIYIKNKGWNFINNNGSLLFDIWFESVFNFDDGYTYFLKENENNYKHYIELIHKNKTAPVLLNNKWNFINKYGKYISDMWFDEISFFYNGFAKVKLNNKYNYISKQGNLISEKWFDDKPPKKINLTTSSSTVTINNNHYFMTTSRTIKI